MFKTRVRHLRLLSFAVLAVPAQLHAAPDPLPRDAPTVARLIAQGPDRFRAYDTDHFTIVTDTRYDTIRPLTARLEGIHNAIIRFCAAMKLQTSPPPYRLPIMLFDRYEEFTAYAAKAGIAYGTAAGFYDQSTNVAAFANVLNTPTLAPVRGEIESLAGRLRAISEPVENPNAVQRRDDLVNHINALRSQQDALVERFNRLVLQHEAAHQVFFNIGVHVRGADNPAWLVEGLACQFEVPQSDLGGDLKHVNQMRLGDLRQALRVAPDIRDEGKFAWRAALASGPLVPLGDLIAAASLSADDSGVAAARYAEAWSLAYFLQHERRDAFSAYLGGLARCADSAEHGHLGRGVSTPHKCGGSEEFHAVFGLLDDAFTRDWARFILRLRYEPDGQW